MSPSSNYLPLQLPTPPIDTDTFRVLPLVPNNQPTLNHNFAAVNETYSSYADSFDLSLLPQECLAPSENIPTTVFQFTHSTNNSSNINSNSNSNSNINNIKSSDNTKQQPIALDTPTIQLQIKIEDLWSCTTKDIKQEPNQFMLPNYHHQQLQQLTRTPNQLTPPPAYPQIYPSPQSSPAQTEFQFPQNQFAGCYDSLSSSRTSLYASSPCPSLDAVGSIKQELHILPPSPPESNCGAPSPTNATCPEIKNETFDADVETLIDLNKFFVKSDKYQQQQNDKQQQQQQAVKNQQLQEKIEQQQQHQVLREYLEDNSFQRRHNLKPLALESFIGGLEEVQSDIEPVISLALEHANREADETCAKLQISKDPSAWTPMQVHAWLRSTIAQFKLPQIEGLESKFCEDGATLLLLSEEEFANRAPECGSILHAQLEIWNFQFNQQTQYATSNEQNGIWNVNMNDGLMSSSEMKMEDNSEEDEEEMLPTSSSLSAMKTNSATNDVVIGTVSVENSNKRVGSSGGSGATVTTGRNGGSHIHLWQFLKELLSTPQMNGTAIRWIDRNKGIFKIEDSVRVAKLWGRRKNRPAMNYDKLSRSIRQYYKKGIMKKTERSQRLVYQFCHPYHL